MTIFKNLCVSLVVALMPFVVMAEEAAHHAAEAGAEAHGEAAAHHAAGIPTAVLLQAANFAIYAALLIYFLRHPIKNFFKTREQSYKQALVKAENARREAEKKKREIQQRLRELDSTADESLDRARAEATTLKLQIQQDAQNLAERLRTETQRAAALEIEKARNVLREEMLKQSVELSQRLLADKMADNDQKRLQTEFVEKIQEVR